MKKIIYSLIVAAAAHGASAQSDEAFSMLNLPYAPDALEPVIGKATVELHYGKHLRAYVNNVNQLVAGTPWAGKSIEEIVAGADGALFNNAGQVLNHDLYFTALSPNGGGEPIGKLADAIKARWKTVQAFKDEFVSQGTALFGSGWVWLAKDSNGQLLIRSYANGGNPVRDGLVPLLGFDVWEHAYYLDYQNRRADHLKALWNIVDWYVVAQRYER